MRYTLFSTVGVYVNDKLCPVGTNKDGRFAKG